MGADLPHTSLQVHGALKEFVAKELLPDLGLDPDAFWSDVGRLVAELTPENQEILALRDSLQQQIDEYHRERKGATWDAADYTGFLRQIGYLEPPGAPFTIDTANVDPEIGTVAGPQLVVPVNNARFALNAANARWGSLYDALYGTDVIPESAGGKSGAQYNAARGASVIAYAARFLDASVPLIDASHADVTEYRLNTRGSSAELGIRANGRDTTLRDNKQFIGYATAGGQTRLLFRHHHLHIEIIIEPDHPIGRQSPAAVSDVVLESAITTIQDCEDSVAAVDAADKVQVYRNWLGLMRGDLTATFTKGGQEVTRALNDDRSYTATSGDKITLPGRSLMLVRNVGHLMTTPAVLTADGSEIFEGILDAVMTTACALYDLRRQGTKANSRTGSIYIVKPKMHGSREVAFANTLFDSVEDLFGLNRYTLKIGVMDEERRTSVNLAECIRAARHRLVFINTGFLDRTGDEIHTSMLAGAALPKDAIKAEPWIQAYEARNVDVGIRCGLPGRAQIGKGMWPMPDEMSQMVDTKAAHLKAGASCAWVPSPTAATLHAMHYHEVDVPGVQKQLKERTETGLDDILVPPLGDVTGLTDAQVQAELDNNAQGILGYVVRWIDQGIGCSKVPDINDVGLMEDRATLRISSQHIANWLRHGVCTAEQVAATFRRMAKIVDEQNQGDSHYQPMGPDFNGVAFCAATDLVFKGAQQPNGYTEPLLHRYRREFKASLGERAD